MLSSSIFNSSSRSTIRNAVAFTAGLAALYGASIVALSNVKIDGLGLLQTSMGNYAVTGDVRGTLQRFRDIENMHNVDILFVGSSHSYASFDPRVFSEKELTSFNLGTPSQTPLNTYYLLEKYLPRLNPKLVIYEIYFPNLASDGLESFYDLAANQAPSTGLLSMALATRNPHALNSFTARLIESLMGGDTEALQLSSPHLTYMEGGFVAHNNRLKDTLFGKTEDIVVDGTQWGYVQDIFDLLHSTSAKVLVVVTPMPDGEVNTITNYADVSGLIADLCADASIPYYDFNAAPGLIQLEFYADYHHLNAAGAELFSAMILDSLAINQSFARRLSLTPEVARR